MRVQMIQTLCGARQEWLAGQTYDLPDNEACQAIRANVATEATEPPAANETPAKKPSKRKGAVS